MINDLTILDCKDID